MNIRPLASTLLPLLLACVPFAGALPAQADPEALERLRRDQEEILRKAERLQELMQRLVQRYERERKPEQVKLLQDGLAHLERSGVLREVASIRDDLASTAFTEASRKQREVVDDLERLLNILLERQSVENLDQQLEQVTAQARTARELEQRQRELLEQARAAMRSPPSPAEQELLDQLQQLRDGERAEAERNARQAGTRRPFLENALERVRELLRDQQQLDRSLADEAAGRTPAARGREFDLGDLGERARELQADLRDQGRTQALGEAARELQREAQGSDQAAVQQARDRADALLQNPPKRGATSEGKTKDPQWAELRERIQQAGTGATEAERERLAAIGADGEQLAAARDDEARQANAAAGERLGEAAAKLAERMRAEGARPEASAPPDAEADPAAAVAEAAERLQEAAAASKGADLAAAQKKVGEALAALDRAKALHQQQHPDAGRKAAEMAAEARAAAQELQNAPSADDAERSASEQLRGAEEALREVERGAEQERPDPGAAQQRAQAATGARENLQQAERTLQQALDAASQDATGDMQAAAERQQQLQQAASDAGQRLQQAREAGAISEQQQQQAQAKLDQARARMEQASQRLQQGQQANAANEQRAAAEQLEQAMQALDENRPVAEAQKQQLQQQAKAQEQLAEDIIRLAEELKQRDNKAAQRAVEQAADAAQKAQRAMEQSDPDETEQQQEEARRKLDEAAKELEQEEDRYQDLRQEELLFRMKDELTSFLERQRPITAQTLDAQKSAAGDGLARAVRTKINQLGEEEAELAGRLEFLVQALTEEGNLVYRTVLEANVADLQEVSRRLAGRRPDVATFTTLLQQDVERRTEELLLALERERKRREQERQEQQQQQQQQPQGRNRFDPQRKRLVSLIAELEMLKQLGIDTRRATDNLRALVDARGDDVISEAEVSLIERLAHRHGEITTMFQQIKAAVEQTLQSMQEQEGEPGQEGGRGR